MNDYERGYRDGQINGHARQHATIMLYEDFLERVVRTYPDHGLLGAHDALHRIRGEARELLRKDKSPRPRTDDE